MTTPEPSASPVDALGALGDLADLADLAEEIAGRAARLLLDGLGLVRSSVSTKSSGTDMVTEMDRASERLIVDALLEARPDDGVLGEEGTERAGTSGIRWVIDPLDGTTNYLYGHPGFAVSIGAERFSADGVPGEALVGVVVDVLHEEVYRAVRGGGATCNGVALAVSTETDLSKALVATGFGYGADRRTAQAAVVAGLIGEIRDIRRMGAGAVDLCAAASGRVDAYFERGLARWDFAAGALIAAEAGAVVGDLHSSGPSTQFTLAAPPALFEALRARLVALEADQVP